MCDEQRLRSACAYAQSDQSIFLLLEYSMTVRLLTKHHLKFLSLTGDCTGSYESTLVKIPNCWKSHIVAHYLFSLFIPMEFPINIDTISMELSILHFKGPQVKISTFSYIYVPEDCVLSKQSLCGISCGYSLFVKVPVYQ